MNAGGGSDPPTEGMMINRNEIESEITAMSEVSENRVSEIEELGDGDEGQRRPLAPVEEAVEPNSRELPIEFQGGEDDDIVYVVISGESNRNCSMDALLWTLNNAAAAPAPAIPNSNSSSGSNTLIFLVHVFPEIRFIPTPLGKLPISQANPEQKQILMEQERTKRQEYLLKFVQLCSASKVKVDTILIESDMEAKAILDLIPILNIKKLVLGSPNKLSSLKKLMKLRKLETDRVADKVFHNAPHFCQVKIICQGKEISKAAAAAAATIS